MDEFIDESDKKRVTDVSEVYADSVDIYDDSLSSFSAFEGHEDIKEEIRSKILNRLDLGTYSPSSLLLFNDDKDIICRQIAKGITGEIPPSWTIYHVKEYYNEIEYKTDSVESTLSEARTCDPSLVILDCLDDMGFSDGEYDQLKTFIQDIRTAEDEVLIIGITSDIDTELVTHESVFEVIIDVPSADDAFLDWMIEREVEVACDDGLISKPEDAWCEEVSLDKYELEVDKLKSGVKRTIQRLLEETDENNPSIAPNDIEATLKIMHAEGLDESVDSLGFFVDEDEEEFEPEIPTVTFSDIGGLEGEKQRLREAVSKPIEHQDVFKDAGYSVGQGILLYGPPGNGKTMLAKAVANELSYRFFAVKGPEMETPFVGETERQIRELFETARDCAPSVIFFDEFDSVAPDRDQNQTSYKQDHVNALLAELDGMSPLDDIIVMAATNRIDSLDDAVTRSGRFDTFIEISNPTEAEKVEIFTVHIDDIPTENNVSPRWFKTQEISDLSGADIATICRKALELAVADFDRSGADEVVVSRQHIRTALRRVRSSGEYDRSVSGYH
jgi:ATP-dependent 26S proteasome regulatory subunit